MTTPERITPRTLKGFRDYLPEAMIPRERLIEIQTSRVENRVHISVTDSARSLDETQLGKLFDAFYTTKKTGMGMGLPISQTIIRDHGGHIWAELGTSRLTRFCIELPAYVAEQQEPAGGVAAG